MFPRLDHLRVDHLDGPLAVARRPPRFAWQVLTDDAGASQESYRITVHLDPPPTCRPTAAPSPAPLVADTSTVRSAACVAVEIPGFVGQEGAEYIWTLQVYLAGRVEPLTARGRFGIGVTTWSAPWIEPVQDRVVVEGPASLAEALAPPPEPQDPPLPPQMRLHPPRHLRHRFHLEAAPVRARLRITSQGVHQPSLNGSPVGDGVLAPGYASYHLAMPVVTHDVTDLLHAGENVLGVILADGWWAGRISALGRSAQYGDLLRASWQLELTDADGAAHLILPGADVVSARGPIDYSDIFVGERHDARAEMPGWDAPGFDDAAWTPCRTVPFDTPVVPFVGNPVRRVLELPVREVLHTPDGSVVLDFGQVLAGRVRMSVRGEAGREVRLEHAEVLDAAGNFLNNIHGVNKDQTDCYVLAGRPEGETWEPVFTFHGFRYVRLSGYPGEVLPQDFTCVVIADDLETTADFRCSDEDLNRLFANTVWSQRSNFLAVPTDCPQRERAGWTGDLQIFAPTAATLMDVAAFLERWLADVRREQASYDGVVPNIVPLPPVMAQEYDRVQDTGEITAAAGWADVITIAPSVLYRHYGDVRFLSENLAAMTAWVDFQRADAAAHLPERLRGVDLDPARRARQELLWNGRMNFGDWLTPSTLDGANIGESIMVAARLTSESVGPMFQAHSLDLLADAHEVLAEDAATRAEATGAEGATAPDAARQSCEHRALAADLRERAAAVREAFTCEYCPGGVPALPDLQGVHVLALAFDMVPETVRPALVERLVDLVDRAGGHLDTGFLSVPYLLDVLWEAGLPGMARDLLRQDTAPSWLYEVRHGATTIWESWTAVGQDGTPQEVSMNHYAFGCVVDWMVHRLAGIEALEPGYRAARLAPDLDGFLTSAAAHVDTPYGRLAVDWQRDGRTADVEARVPVGATARVDLPDGWQLVQGSALLTSGRHHLHAVRTDPDPRPEP